LSCVLTSSVSATLAEEVEERGVHERHFCGMNVIPFRLSNLQALSLGSSSRRKESSFGIGGMGGGKSKCKGKVGYN
jgi:hypothetical protein